MGTLDQADWQELVATARALPLDRVATALGYRRDVTDKARWKRPGSVLSINGEKFFDHLAGTGGGGAISLVMHAGGGGFRDAVAFLSEQGLRSRSPQGRDGAAPPARRRRLDLPARSRASWPEVRDRLVTERGIGGMLLQVCHDRGLVYADCRGNAVFVSRDVSGKATGAEIVGLGRRGGGAAFKGMAPGSRKASGGFWMARDAAPPEQAVLVESAIDALSVLTLRSFPGPEGGFAAVSAAGVATSVPRWLDGWRLRRIHCGYDADRAGDAAAARLARNDPRVVRCRPAVDGEDWNDMLVRETMGEPVWSDRPEDGTS